MNSTAKAEKNKNGNVVLTLKDLNKNPTIWAFVISKQNAIELSQQLLQAIRKPQGDNT